MKARKLMCVILTTAMLVSVMPAAVAADGEIYNPVVNLDDPNNGDSIILDAPVSDEEKAKLGEPNILVTLEPVNHTQASIYLQQN